MEIYIKKYWRKRRVYLSSAEQMFCRKYLHILLVINEEIMIYLKVKL